MGMAHVLIFDPWSITLTANLYRKSVSLSVFIGILTRILYVPAAILLIRIWLVFRSPGANRQSTPPES